MRFTHRVRSAPRAVPWDSFNQCTDIFLYRVRHNKVTLPHPTSVVSQLGWSSPVVPEHILLSGLCQTTIFYTGIVFPDNRLLWVVCPKKWSRPLRLLRSKCVWLVLQLCKRSHLFSAKKIWVLSIELNFLLLHLHYNSTSMLFIIQKKVPGCIVG